MLADSLASMVVRVKERKETIRVEKIRVFVNGMHGIACFKPEKKA